MSRVLCREKRKQIVGDPLHAARFANQLCKLIPSLRPGDSFAHQFAIAHDDGKRIVEFMRHSGQQLPQGGQLFRPDQLRVQRLQFDGYGKITGEHFDAGQLDGFNRGLVPGRG